MRTRSFLAVMACLAVAGCGQPVAATTPAPHRSPSVRTHAPSPAPTFAATSTSSPTPTSTPTPTSSATTLPDTLPELPGTGFASKVAPVPADVLARSTWSPSCPVLPDRLDWVQLTFRGFDGSRHTGELLVRDSVASEVVDAFRELWAAGHPLQEMTILSKDDLLTPTAETTDTSAFLCRPGHTGGSSGQDQGLTVDVHPAGPDVVRAFAHVGWKWGGPVDPTRFNAP